MNNGIQTFGKELEVFLQYGEYENFARETYRTSFHITYVICGHLHMDASGVPVRAHFEQKGISIPVGGEVQYSPELKQVIANIGKTIKALTPPR